MAHLGPAQCIDSVPADDVGQKAPVAVSCVLGDCGEEVAVVVWGDVLTIRNLGGPPVAGRPLLGFGQGGGEVQRIEVSVVDAPEHL